MKKLFLLPLLVAILPGCSCNSSPGPGDKVGQIAKIQTQGLVCKTPVILVTGKFGGGELHAAIRESDTKLLELAHHYNDTQEQVKVFYHAEWIASVCEVGDHAGTTFVDRIEPWSTGAAGVGGTGSQ
jgi:hypothetical protein